jgi:predicted HicB family RNase H-like nuclease
MIDILKPLIKQFMPFAQKQMGFDRPPRLFLKNDSAEADNPMGKTGFYDPGNESITIYIGKRHPKDIMRSLSHELMHHTQNCNGEFDGTSNMGEQGYAQTDGHLRTMEIQAYQASIVFRDWEDSTKGTIYYEHLQKGDYKMSMKDWKNKEIKTLLTEHWGFQMDLSKMNEDIGGAAGELTDEEADKEDAGDAPVSTDEDDGNLKEDSGEREGHHYDDNRMSDDDHIKAIEHHLAALKDDRDYDDDHIDENKDEGNEEIEEASTPKRNAQGREPARRIRKEQLDAVVKKAIKEALQKRKG